MRFMCSLVLVLLLIVSVMPADARENVELIKKTDNFAFLLDHSSSMRWSFMEQGPRIEQAKILLSRINAEIPALDYKGGLYTFGPTQARVGMETYDQPRFERAISDLETEYSRFFRATPIGRGLEMLSHELPPLSGKVDVIVLTDGGQNVGPSPLAIANAMAQEMDGRLCIHVVSYARTDAERALVEQLGAVTPCSDVTPAQDLASDQSVKEFVERIFYEGRPVIVEKVAPVLAPVTAPAPAPSPAPVEEIIVLRGINFDFDKADIKPEFQAVLDEAVLILEESPETRVVIEGHTDWTGPDDYNQKLSERRAQSVMSYLVKHGITVDRLESKGLGKSKPAYDNSTREGRSMNRRVEFQITK
jgi:OmpA-OmpF porin, OOP family